MAGGNPAALAKARQRKFEEWFKDRHWRVMTEVTCERTVAILGGYEDVTITYTGGHFRITPPGRYKTPFGQTGRTGVLIAEMDTDGADTGEVAAFGPAALRHAQEAYGLIRGLS